jgi:hypothetical protein
MIDPRQHNYYKKLMQLVEQGRVPLARAAEVEVYHDPWCSLLRGGCCNCDPEIKLPPLPEQN